MLTEELVTAVAVISGLCTIIEFAHKVVAKIKANHYKPKHLSK